MLDSPKISIIIPVFQAEKTINRCLDSVMNQNFTSYEVIVIDDGSTDKSSQIIENYRKSHAIKVIHQPNKGIAETRGVGVKIAKGEYILFVDSDDWIDEDCLGILYDRASSLKTDMMITDYYAEFGNRSEYVCQMPSSPENKDIVNGLCGNLMGSLWNKLIKRELFTKYNIEFEKKLKYCEDWITIYKLLQHPINVTYFNFAFYHYDHYSNSVSLARTLSVDNYRNRLEFFRILGEVGMPEKYPVGYNHLLCNLAYVGIRSNYYDTRNFKKQYKNIDVKNSGLSVPKKVVLWTGFFTNLYVAKLIDNMFRGINDIIIYLKTKSDAR